MTYQAKVFVTLKEGVLDPQGNAVQQGLRSMGHAVGDVRVGRYILLNVEAQDESAARAEVDDMCRRLLANPVIEEYVFELTREA